MYRIRMYRWRISGLDWSSAQFERRNTEAAALMRGRSVRPRIEKPRVVVQASGLVGVYVYLLWIPVLSVAEHTWTMSLAWSPWAWEHLVRQSWLDAWWTYVHTLSNWDLSRAAEAFRMDQALGIANWNGFFNKPSFLKSVVTPRVACTFCVSWKDVHLHFIYTGLVSLNLAEALPEMIRPKLSGTGSVQIVEAIESSTKAKHHSRQ